jgi:hypothetical protein
MAQRMRPDLEETEAARTLREGSENVQPSDQAWGPPAGKTQRRVFECPRLASRPWT